MRPGGLSSFRMQTLILDIQGMHCQNCAEKVVRALKLLPGVAEAQVDATSRSGRVELDEQQCRPADVVAAVQRAGFQVSGFRTS